MISRPHDTTPVAFAAQNAAFDRMGAQARLRAAVDLSESVREIRIAGIAARHPEMDRSTVVARLILEEYGVELPDSR